MKAVLNTLFVLRHLASILRTTHSITQGGWPLRDAWQLAIVTEKYAAEAERRSA